jgi:hypothetical protein
MKIYRYRRALSFSGPPSVLGSRGQALVRTQVNRSTTERSWTERKS